MSVLLERVQHSLQSTKNDYRKTLHHFASNGDSEAVSSLLEHHPQINIDIHSSSRNTALHAALIQNQQGLIIDYLIQKGANVNAYNLKGFNPIVLAIKHCRNGTQALEKLIEAGASLQRFEKGRFVGLTLIDLAKQFRNQEVLPVLKQFGCSDDDNDDSKKTDLVQSKEGTKNEEEKSDVTGMMYCQYITNENMTKSKKSTSSNKKNRKEICPICNCSVKFPTRMSFLQFNQEQAEKEYYDKLQQLQKLGNQNNTLTPQSLSSSSKISVKTNKGSEIYIKRKYLDQFINHNNGEAYKQLCTIEYHGVGNMHKQRKEISESYSILHAVQECWMTLKNNGLQNDDTNTTTTTTNTTTTRDEINFKNVYLVDLCSGKSMTAALCAALFTKEHNNQVLAVDKLPSQMVPHYFHEGNITYLSRDIMTEIFYKELEEAIQRQTQNEGRTVILVGMHLCGILSERAIEFFKRIEDIQGIILSPCCFPKLRKRQDGKYEFISNNSLDDDGKYMLWSKHLKTQIQHCMPNSAMDHIKSYNDDEIHSTKNSIIIASRSLASTTIAT